MDLCKYIKKPELRSPGFSVVSESAPSEAAISGDCEALREMTLFSFTDEYAEQSPGDAALWMDLFIWAEQEAGIRLAEILQRIRAKGAMLERSQQFGYTINPVYGPAGKWSGGIEYGAARQELMQYQGSVVKLLLKVREAYP